MIEQLRKTLLEKVQGEVEILGVGGLKGQISDGYHTFDELYEHRITLFIALCKELYKNPAYQTYNEVWRMPVDNGWFLMGINTEAGKQITYHLPESKWKETDFASNLHPKSYNYDGHKSSDVLERLRCL
jgi:hypothetical protein